MTAARNITLHLNLCCMYTNACIKQMCVCVCVCVQASYQCGEVRESDWVGYEAASSSSSTSSAVVVHRFLAGGGPAHTNTHVIPLLYVLSNFFTCP